MSFSSFLTKAINENEYDYIVGFPKPYLDIHEKKIVDFCLNYYSEFGVLPPSDFILSSVENAELFVHKTVSKEPIDKLFSEAKRINSDREILTRINRVRESQNKDFKNLSSEINYLLSFRKDNKLADINELDYSQPESRFKFKFKTLQENTGGLLPNELCVFAGALKTKKTWITLDLALDAWLNQNKKVYFTSIEMSAKETLQRTHALIGGFNPIVFRKGTKEELNKSKLLYEYAFKAYGDNIGELYIPKTITKTMQDIISDIKNYSPEIVFIDSMYRLQDQNGNPISQDWSKMQIAISQMKDIAREYDIQVVINTQLVRGASSEITEDDLAFSHHFGREADIVFGIQKDDNSTNERVKINMVASRSTPKDTQMYLTFDWDNCKIDEFVPKILRGL